jgi:hypothetical protein
MDFWKLEMAFLVMGWLLLLTGPAMGTMRRCAGGLARERGPKWPTLILFLGESKWPAEAHALSGWFAQQNRAALGTGSINGGTWFTSMRRP